MHFSTAVLSAAIALSSTVLASPMPDTIATEASFSAQSASFKAVTVRDNFCSSPSAPTVLAEDTTFEVGAVVQVNADVKCFGSHFNKRMNTPAHLTYEKALYLYQDVHHLIIHTLTKKGMARFKRLVEIAAKIQRAYEYLDEAEKLNKHDNRRIRRKWIRHEIRHLRHKLEDARWIALHLPNLALCEEAFHFVVDLSLKVVEFVIELPLIIGAAIGAAIHIAVHAVVETFHFIAHVLKWAVKGVIHAFIKFHRKVKKALKKLGHKLHEIGHEIKEGLKDVGSVILDIGHHMFHHHHHHCEKGDFGVIVVGGGEEEECQYEETDLCITGAKQCTRDEFVMKAQMHYDVEFSWTREESVTKVTECMHKVNSAFIAMKAEVQRHESQVVAANWEGGDEAEEAEE